ncbi:hypothetical protein BVV10_13080 [Xanthomonas oryzae pv. oryzae]|uniref:putative type VI secretion system effector n=1 Tax=Xanthomonas oryzae TaxID=347 RepID=UPI000C7AFA22|nr:putative type VI secretion system effector [Xanthomonas oryzae]AUI90893.1 hypothetical protein BVV16_13065 [Xanthomonas oryzae pv. oryzae]AUI94566.1 hypothetical protein BVV17_13070 [Xanthomonas oryzae pv. oryzae]AUI98237.1 hypothetical protein BVV18_13075 [Xanthomonas oryzae pv. oryzae]AUJ01914.1 hypothetical protein BVV10_13080 [Xanthomonas oryzae pv. oryzae]AUJ05584.1 hypothetical protein BVV19_13100 [Xanthomonas oryzae pv. oryzae]
MNEAIEAKVLGGKLHNLALEDTTIETFVNQSDQAGMASTGVLAAALGLSGQAAGMVAMSLDEMRELVVKASFDVAGERVEALLWNFPYYEGTEVQVVVDGLTASGAHMGFAVVAPTEGTGVFYPHVSAGRIAHRKRVIKWSAIAGGVISSFTYFLILITAFFAGNVRGQELSNLMSITALGAGAFFLITLIIGYRLGRRFDVFISMAEKIFLALGWKDIERIDLRKVTKQKRKPTDPPALGDTFFRY